MKRDMPPREYRADNICYKLFMRPLDEVIKPGTLVKPNFYPERYKVRRIVRSQSDEYPVDIVAYDLWVSPADGDQQREIPLYGYVAVGASVVSVYSDNENALDILTDDGYPTPNEHGVYSKKGAHVTSFSLQKHCLTIYVLQIEDNKFIADRSYEYKNGGNSSPLCAREVFPTLEIAVDSTLASALWFIIKNSLHSADEARFAKKFLTRCIQQLPEQRRTGVLASLSTWSEEYAQNAAARNQAKGSRNL
ncbi:hypothetical protein ACIPLR_17590 [Herbaspirillum huttiense]|uniref:hypothetical protein n=1 Tax=Herbaspirillum huttiense TaxID=863372 RepID=UPI0037FD0E9A